MAGSTIWERFRPAPRDLACQEMVELVSSYLDGELPRRTRRRVERHLAACDGCDRYLEQMRTTRVLVGSVTGDSLDPVAVGALLEAFRGYRG